MRSVSSTWLLLWLLLQLALAGPLHAQEMHGISFEGPFNSPFEIDTADGHGGLWQIGPPQKNVFTTAASLPNVIVTDTLNSYPPNCTSHFTIFHLAQLGWEGGDQFVTIEGYYQVDADSLNDMGTIEIQYAPDSGWIDILNDSVFAPLVIWETPKPTLTGSSNGWTLFRGDVVEVAAYINSSIGYQVSYGDTIRWRFSFTSDSIDTQRDGLMFDSFDFSDYAQAIPEDNLNTFHSQVAPMPVSEALTLIYETAGLSALVLTIQDARGVIVRRESLRAIHRSTFYIGDLSAGPYFYTLQSQDGTQFSRGSFVKE